MGSAIVTAIASVISYFAAKGVDHIIAKWVAYFTIAWDKSASKRAQDSVRAVTTELQNDLASKSAEWKAWRDKLKKPEGSNGPA